MSPLVVQRWWWGGPTESLVPGWVCVVILPHLRTGVDSTQWKNQERAQKEKVRERPVTSLTFLFCLEPTVVF